MMYQIILDEHSPAVYLKELSDPVEVWTTEEDEALRVSESEGHLFAYVTGGQLVQVG